MELGFVDVKFDDATATSPPHLRVAQRYKTIKGGFEVVGDLLERARVRFGVRDFLVSDFEDGKRHTYAEVYELVGRIAHELVGRFGVRGGDRVAVLGRNSTEWVIAYLAATAIGATVVPMNSWWTSSEIEYGLNDSGAKVVFVDEERFMRLNEIPQERLKALEAVVGMHFPKVLPDQAKLRSFIRFDEVLKSGVGKKIPPCSVKPDDNAMIMYTSGTTANPKGVVLTHRGVCAVMNDMILATGFQDKDPPLLAIMLTVPLFHASGTHVIFLASICLGRKVVIMYKWDAGKALELIERERITNFIGVPTMSIELMNHPDIKKWDTSSLESVGGGGAPTPPSAVKDIVKNFPKAKPTQGYGLTETNAISTFNSAENYIQRPTSCGRPIPIVDIEIWKDGESEKGRRELPANTPGRVMIRGVTLMKEYWNKPEATAEAITADGWFDSGDIGRLDEEGFLYIMDRAKDLIIRGGENISCAEVEAAVYHHPAVAEAAVFGAPHPVLGEEVAVAVHLKPNSGKLDLATLQEVCRSHIAKFKIPTHLLLWEGQLPRGATGKILKREIRQAVLQKSKL